MLVDWIHEARERPTASSSMPGLHPYLGGILDALNAADLPIIEFICRTFSGASISAIIPM